ncbi:MAG: SbmA/BacA-like family transporter [Gemmataceae bacterium]
MRRRWQDLRRRLLAVALPVFSSPAGPRAFAGLGLLLGLLLTVNTLNVVNSYAGRDLMTAVAEGRLGRFYQLAAGLVCVFAASTLVEVSTRYTEQRLALAWRNWLTRRLIDRYLAGRAYQRLAFDEEVDNPDQRITEDAKAFAETTLSFLILLVNAVLTVVAFAGVLWSITPWLLAAVVGYAATGSLGALLLGRSLVGLNNQQQRREADLRFELARLREHAAEVARSGGEPDRKARLVERLAALVENFRRVIAVNRNLGFFIGVYNYLPQIIPAAIVAPLYIRGEVEFGAVTQAAMAFTQALGAFSLIVSQFQLLSTYGAVAHRLGALWEATEPEEARPPGRG